MAKRKSQPAPNPLRMWSWTPERRASRDHIREAIRYARWEKSEIGEKSEVWYASASAISQRWRDHVRASSLHALARQHLEYWHYRAFLPGAYGIANSGDRPAHERWLQFTQ